MSDCALQVTGAEQLLHDVDADDLEEETLTEVLDMSWSTILGRSLSCPAGQQSLDVEENFRRQHGDDVDHVSVSVADPELDELIRACAADADGGAALDCLGEFDLDVDVVADSLDLTVYGVGLRPPDWWSTLGDSFDSPGSRPRPSGAGDVTAATGLNTPSPGCPAPFDGDRRQQQQEQHPWAENRGGGSITVPSFDSSFDALDLLPGGPPITFDCDSVDDF